MDKIMAYEMAKVLCSKHEEMIFSRLLYDYYIIKKTSFLQDIINPNIDFTATSFQIYSLLGKWIG
jgi:hypothetical protein